MAVKNIKKKDYLKKMRSLSLDNLMKKLYELKRELLTLRFQKAGGELKDVSQFKKVKINIAIAYNIIKEKNKKSYAS